MTLTAIPPASTTDEEMRLLFEEARRRRRLRRIWGSLIVAGVVILVAALLIGWNGRAPSTPRSGHPIRQVVPQGPSNPPAPVGASLDAPEALAVASDGGVLISNEGSNQILERQTDGTLQVVAGDGRAGFSGDGGSARAAQLNDPQGLAVALDGTVFVADNGNNRVPAISPTGVITTVAHVAAPSALAIGPNGELYVADQTGVQSVDVDGSVSTIIAASCCTKSKDSSAVSIDGISVVNPWAIAVSTSGRLYIADFSSKSLLQYSDGTLSLVGTAGSTYVTPAGLAAAPNGTILVGDYGRFSVDRVSGSSLTAVVSFSLNSLPGIVGTFRPSGVATAPDGEIYADADGVNGGSNTPCLVAIAPDGAVQLLSVGHAAG